MKILITGGAGFIGSALIRFIIESTDYKVINIDKLTYAGNIESLSSVEKNPNYVFEQIDICNEYELNQAFNKYNPTCVMHLAAESHVDRSIEGPSEFINTNVIGTFNLLNISKQYFSMLSDIEAKNFRFHHISTDEVYGDLGNSKDFFTETTPYAPSSPYSATKAASDHLVRAWGRTYGLPILITNCSNNYGPYHFPEKLIPHIILSALSGKKLPVYGDGSQIRDWLFVEDHAKALLLVLKEGVCGETYNIGGHNEKTNLQVVNHVCDLLNELCSEKPEGIENFKELITFVDDRPGHDTRYAIDALKIKNDLGWVPEETFESGLRKTVIWYLNNRSWWQRIISKEYQLKRIGDST